MFDDEVGFYLFSYSEQENGPFRTSLSDYAEALGSGSKFALTALSIGKNPVEAVEIACNLDVYSGGKVNYFDPYRKLNG